MQREIFEKTRREISRKINFSFLVSRILDETRKRETLTEVTNVTKVTNVKKVTNMTEVTSVTNVTKVTNVTVVTSVTK